MSRNTWLLERSFSSWRILICLAASSGLSACATLQTEVGNYKGNTSNLKSADIEKFREEQDAIVGQFVAMAGTNNATGNDKWRPVVDVGMQYVDERCGKYLEALFWLNRVRETSSKQIQYTGAATSALLALVNAAKELIGIAPLGFGLLDQTVNNVGQGLLYNLDPGIVSGLVERQQTAFRQAIEGTQFTTRGAAMQAIQHYAALCLPVNIEGEVNRAIANSEFKRDPSAPPPADNTNVIPDIVQTPPEDH